MKEALEEDQIRLTYINYNKPPFQLFSPHIYKFRYQIEFACVDGYEVACEIFKVKELPVDSKGRLYVEYTEYWCEKVGDGVYDLDFVFWLART
jgi:hypothetical protein